MRWGVHGGSSGIQQSPEIVHQIFLEVHMCFVQEEGPLLIRDLMCKSEFLFGCFLEMLKKNYKLSNRFQLVTLDLWYINTPAPWLLRWDDSLSACITQSSKLSPQESAPIPHYNSLDITLFLIAFISLSHFPISLSVLDPPNNLLVLESWPWGSASGSTHPKTNPQHLETLRVKWLSYQGSQRSLHLLSVGETSLHVTQTLTPIIRVNNQPGSVHKAQSCPHVSSARLPPCVVNSAPPEADHQGVPPWHNPPPSREANWE